MKIRSLRLVTVITRVALAVGTLGAMVPALAAQEAGSTYQPKFPGDPARSDSEAAAPVILRAMSVVQPSANRLRIGLMTTSGDCGSLNCLK